MGIAELLQRAQDFALKFTASLGPHHFMLQLHGLIEELSC